MSPSASERERVCGGRSLSAAAAPSICFESLENRRLLSSAPALSSLPDAFVQNGVLVVLGTPGADQFGVSLATDVQSQALVYEVDWHAGASPVPIGQHLTAPADGVLGIQVRLGKGDDVLTVAQSNSGSVQAVTVPVTVFAGDGNDTVTGAASPNVIHGGAGNDSLMGGSGDDQLFGGPGGDTLRGSAGNDTLTGGTAANQLFGGAGDDALFAINGQADTLFGGTGNDTAHIDPGRDLITNNDVEHVLNT